MQEQKKMVSIIIPTYNSGKYLLEAIESCLNQTYKNIEIIVIDDGSTDNTKYLLKNYIEEGKIKYFYQQNRGRSAARNLGLEKASGEFIQFLDADDYIHHKKIEKQIKLFNKNKDIGLVYCGAIYIKDNVQIHKLLKKVRSKNFLYKLIQGNFLPIHAPIFKSEFKVKFDEQYSHMEDWDYWIRLITKYNVKIGHINEFLSFIRVHNNNTSKERLTMLEAEQNLVNKYIKEFKDKRMLAYLYLKKFKLKYRVNKKIDWHLLKDIISNNFILIFNVAGFILKQITKKILRYKEKEIYN
ncbi:glycosyltransferase family 2 protein [Clostridium thermopalmarium]|uniref:UDP-Glc:alpha-D-GlcNAc-diphosphoundecaprenol beta-1,3-glucosyltransferase WfgD n=1 Tax=Clostridium thermopalmarium DSM 5974 TaxID=1121340 RepID=A0A2T0ALR0_9CLOT|nr:glycosyltransferase [Clostridium thermopalmarium]PRR69664.1 UDP-Glc:alpha-D-GlcNAc-diphosphoundecaprenol beta-1,3-glucosyltransferase WfgD [Clostridium thermopalmarium DSM 5974]PVZ24267.1 glycosyltransferase involved in cell wall biosynthesis [Clostridium thermopalmarium DSM 5974]